MSEIEAELNRAAATYWLSVAAKAGPGQTPSLAKATTLLRDARAESRTSTAPPSQPSTEWKPHPWTCQTSHA